MVPPSRIVKTGVPSVFILSGPACKLAVLNALLSHSNELSVGVRINTDGPLKKPPKRVAFLMVPSERIELSTSPLPMERSTTELRRQYNQAAPYLPQRPQ